MEEKAKLEFSKLLYLLPASIEKRGVAKSKGFSYRYVLLDDLLKTVKQCIRKNKLDLMVTQKLFSRDGKNFLETLFFSSDGSQITSGPLLLETATTQPQAFGAAVTYMRRYQLQSLLGVAGEADTDGI